VCTPHAKIFTHSASDFLQRSGAEGEAGYPPASINHFFFLSGRWDNADPAAVFESLPVRPSRSTLDAAFPALALVCSFFAMIDPPVGATFLRPVLHNANKSVLFPS
jgi:hypothetical protein